MARYDKYNPKVGGYRAPLAADFDPANLERCLGVGHDANGRVVIGAGANGRLKGVLVLTKARKAGDIVDVMTDGEIVEFGPSDAASTPGVDFATAGADYFAAANGEVTETVGGTYVGHVVAGGQRLIVRFGRVAA